jgi:hypothetical protein
VRCTPMYISEARRRQGRCIAGAGGDEVCGPRTSPHRFAGGGRKAGDGLTLRLRTLPGFNLRSQLAITGTFFC